MDFSDFLTIGIFIISILFGIFGKKKKLPENPNKPSNEPIDEEDGSVGTGIPELDDAENVDTRSLEDVTWSDLFKMVGKKNRHGAAPVDVQSVDERRQPAVPFLQSSHEGEQSVRTTSPEMTIRDVVKQTEISSTDNDFIPKSIEDWRKAVIANEILNRKY